MKRSFLVVGGAGYVGSHMVKHLLAHGHEVTVFDNLSRGHREAAQTARLVVGDLLDPAALRTLFAASRFDVVMHFAALAYVWESVRIPEAYYRNNFVGTLNLLDAMGEAAVRKLVFSSTCATYGNPSALPIAESHRQDPINPYGASKLMAERAIRDYGAAHGLDSIALRYFNAAGCDRDAGIGQRHDPETRLIPLALAEALRVGAGGDPHATGLQVNGTDYATRDGTCIRDYVHVEDLASAHLLAAEKLMAGDAKGSAAYNLGTGHGVSVLEAIASCRKVSGVPIEYRVSPRREGDPPELVASNAAARRELGWTPRYVAIDPIVETVWRWMTRPKP